MCKKAIALGTFDGLHIAHKEVLNTALSSGFEPCVLTFKIPPKFSLTNSSGLIISTSSKNKMLKEMGFKVIELDFLSIKEQQAEEFLEYIKLNFNPKVICCGYNYKFGKDAKGDVNLLKEYFKDEANVIVSNKITKNGVTVSSSNIRAHITQGDMQAVKDMLGYYFNFSSPVISGDKRGRTIGFPTINQKFDSSLITPRFGVYKTEVEIDGKKYSAISNFGLRPSFKTDGILCETHIIDYNKDLYNKEVTVYFKEFLRDEIKFNSLKELQEQIKKDKQSL